MSNLTDKFLSGISLFTRVIVSFLLEKKYKCLMPCLHETRLRDVNAFSQTENVTQYNRNLSRVNTALL